jgi:hypothetical protein
MQTKLKWEVPVIQLLQVNATSSDACGTGINVNKPGQNSDGAGSLCS